MRLVFATCVWVMVGLSGCATAERNGLPVADGPAYRRLETVAYYWEGRRVEVTFHREARDGAWLMSVRDSWSIFEQSPDAKKRVWDQSAARVPMEQCLQMIDRSLLDFRAEKSLVRLESLDIDMHVVQDLWSEMLMGLRQTLSKMDGTLGESQLDVPDEIYNEIKSVLEKSPVVTAIKELLEKHGLSVRRVYISDKVLFDYSLAGHKWSEIATLPAIGVIMPGSFQFALNKSRLGTAQTTPVVKN